MVQQGDGDGGSKKRTITLDLPLTQLDSFIFRLGNPELNLHFAIVTGWRGGVDPSNTLVTSDEYHSVCALQRNFCATF